MSLTDITGHADVIGALLIGGFLVYQRVRTGTGNVWRDEAEAQIARSQRLSDDLTLLITEVRNLRDENAGLRLKWRSCGVRIVSFATTLTT
ncbi:gp48 [Lomovskayavirus C31]|uniref:Gp48 n=1 Tax=Streptomyces phage phiC31 TaxID=10719 RepID=Q9ZXA0_BPPHC|nr:gp48 [Lomovskayavirus C31]CAA07118.1 gp48 [Lomovskayavirus C31]